MKSNRLQLMSEGNVSRSLFQLGMPMVVSMLITALYNVVDTYFVSGLGKQAVAAVSVAFPISLVFSGIGLTFGAGAGSYISRLLGKKEKEMADRVACVALFSSIGVGIVVAALGLLFLAPVLQFMGGISSILDLAKEYAVIFIISTIFSTANVAAGNLAVAQGASDISLKAMISGAVLNMILDPVCIRFLGMGVRGAAAATLISQIVTSGIYIWFFMSGKSYVKITLSGFKPSVGIYKEILKVGVSMLLLQLLSGLSMSRISAAAGLYGEDAIAAMGIVLRIVTLGTNVVFGYMKGFQPMAGFNYGAKNYVRLKAAIKSCLQWTTGFCIVFTIFIFLFATPVLSLFSDDAQVLAIAVPALRANTIMFFTFGLQFTYSTLYLAIGKALVGGALNICRQGVMFIPVILIFPALWGMNGVIWSQAAADILTSFVTVYFAVRIHRRLEMCE
ncbi:MAG: MATE family efflux transporter [Eubacteriales bacterium]|nr:MATE family efflux transporter [Eubacteriales bacterium]